MGALCLVGVGKEKEEEDVRGAKEVVVVVVGVGLEGGMEEVEENLRKGLDSALLILCNLP